jgi:hypothetical protein
MTDSPYCRADESPKAKGDARSQQTENNLPPTGFPEGRAGCQAHARAYPKHAKYAEYQADHDGGEAVAEDERDHRDNRSESEEEK